MTDGTGLAGVTAALDVHDHVETAGGIGQSQGLTHLHLQGFVAEIIVDATLVNGDIALTGDQTNASDRLFSPANGMEANLRHFPSSSLTSGF